MNTDTVECKRESLTRAAESELESWSNSGGGSDGLPKVKEALEDWIEFENKVRKGAADGPTNI